MPDIFCGGGGASGILEYLFTKYCFKRDYQKYVHYSGINWPPNHPGGVALIKRKNKRLGFEPMRKL